MAQSWWQWLRGWWNIGGLAPSLGGVSGLGTLTLRAIPAPWPIRLRLSRNHCSVQLTAVRYTLSSSPYSSTL